MNKERGDWGESLARTYLESQGLTVVETNYRFHHGEIDIIAEEGEILVFCEVKTRTSARFGRAENAVSLHKRRQIRRLAEAYLALRHVTDRACRFDVVAINVEGGRALVNHIRNAFW